MQKRHKGCCPPAKDQFVDSRIVKQMCREWCGTYCLATNHLCFGAGLISPAKQLNKLLKALLASRNVTSAF